MFLKRTDALALKKRLGTEALAQELGFSRASFWGYRTGGRPISAKAWSKLESAERSVDLETSETFNASKSSLRPDAQRDATLSRARARTERYGEAAGQALEETLEDLRDHLEMLAASGPALSAAAVQACKDRIDAFVQELTRQRSADDLSHEF